MIDGNTKISDLMLDENQNELEHKAHETNDDTYIDKDFYDKLPEWITYDLDLLYDFCRNFDWFAKAWKDYRNHVLTSKLKNLRAPGYVFNEYFKDLTTADYKKGMPCHLGDYYIFSELRTPKERERDFKEVCYSEDDETCLFHDASFEQQHPRGAGGKFVPKGFSEKDERRLKELGKENALMIAERKNKELKEQPYKEAVENAQKVVAAEVKSVNDIGNGVKSVANGVDAVIQSTPGSNVKTTYGTYPNLSNKELQDKINRIRLEQQYSDAVGDSKTVLTGKGKAHEALQTLTALTGIGVGIAGIIIGLRGGKSHK